MAKSLPLGTVLKMENPATVGTLTIGNLTSIGVPGPTREEVPSSDFDSTAAEFLAGLPDFGEMAFAGNFNGTNAGQTAFEADAQNVDAPAREYIIEIPRQNIKYTFSGWAKSFVPSMSGISAPIEFSGSIRVTGPAVRSALP